MKKKTALFDTLRLPSNSVLNIPHTHTHTFTHLWPHPFKGALADLLKATHTNHDQQAKAHHKIANQCICPCSIDARNASCACRNDVFICVRVGGFSMQVKTAVLPESPSTFVGPHAHRAPHLKCAFGPCGQLPAMLARLLALPGANMPSLGVKSHSSLDLQVWH